MWWNTLPNGTGLQNVIMWYDGLGPCDRRTKTAYTKTNITDSTLVKGGRALTFNGTTSKIDCGGQIVGTGDITACAWVYASGWGEDGYGRIFDNGKFILRISTDDDTIQVASDGVTFADSSYGYPSLSSWSFIVVSRLASGAGCITYCNGVNISASGSSGTPANGSTNLILGNSNAGSSTFDGSITQWIIFNKILTATQVGQMYRRM